MKAKDYAELFKTDPGIPILGTILKKFVQEGKALAEIRHAHSNEAIFAIMTELSQKYKRYIALINYPGVREDAFERFWKGEAPNIYGAWQNYEADIRLNAFLRSQVSDIRNAVRY